MPPTSNPSSRRLWRIARWAALCLLLVVVLVWTLEIARCSRRDWKDNPLIAATRPGGPATSTATLPAGQDLLAGHWSGSWASNDGVLSGALTSEIRKTDDGTYQAKFVSVAAGFLTQTNVVDLHVHRTGPAWEFSGQKNLGLLYGGVYKYEGHCDGQDFVCTYDSSIDRGVFRMARRAAPTTAPTTAP